MNEKSVEGVTQQDPITALTYGWGQLVGYEGDPIQAAVPFPCDLSLPCFHN